MGIPCTKVFKPKICSLSFSLDFPYDYINSTPASYDLYNTTRGGLISMLPHPNVDMKTIASKIVYGNRVMKDAVTSQD
jgi:hypothetical protein